MSCFLRRAGRALMPWRAATRGVLLAVLTLSACKSATHTPAFTPAATRAPSAPAVVETPTVAPPATPGVALLPVPPGWARYTNDAVGLTFTYPAPWSLVETPADASQPAAVWLRWESYRLLIQHKGSGSPVRLQAYGSARNWREAGAVGVLGQDVTREVLVFEGKAKRVTYRVDRGPIATDDLVIAVVLRSIAADECLGVFDLECDYASVNLPDPVQAEADRIVQTIERVPVAPPPVADLGNWYRYVRADYGFSFYYPPSWILSEGSNFVALTQGTVRLVIGYGNEIDATDIRSDYGPGLAGARDTGSVRFLDRLLDRSVVGEGDSVRAVVYGGGERVDTADRAFVVHLQDYSAESRGAPIPERLQLEADEVLASMVLHSPALPLPGPAIVPTQEPATPTPEVTIPPDAVVSSRGAGARVRSGPGALHEVVGLLVAGEQAHVVGTYRDWWQIDFGGQPAWVAHYVVEAQNVENVPEVEPTLVPRATPLPEVGPTLVVGSSKLNVRAGPGTSYLRVGTLDPGARVEIRGRHGEWWQVLVGGEVGWVIGDYATAYNAEDVPEADPPEVGLSPSPAVIPPPAIPSEITEARWIDLDLSEQQLTVYENSGPIYRTLVSTGLPSTPTPTGQFRIWIKLRYDDMSGTDYYLEDVPYVMYFYQGYGFHGVWWHGNFGHPMSHGCVNLPNGADEWLFEWADVGTLVNIHE